MSIVFFLVAGWLFLAGLYGIVTSRNLVHLVVCLSIVQASTYLTLLGIGYRTHGTVAVLVSIPPGAPFVDPIVASLTLTDVVVSATVTALLLALAVQIHKRTGSVDPDDIVDMRG